MRSFLKLSTLLACSGLLLAAPLPSTAAKEAPPTPTVASITLTPTSVTGGASSTGTVTLTGPAPSGFVVSLSSSNPAVASFSQPGPFQVKGGTPTLTLEFPVGQNSVNFAVTTKPVTMPTGVGIAVSGGGVTRTPTARLTVLPPALQVAATTSPSVSQVAASVNIPAQDSGSVAAECPAGTRVTGGGYGIGSNLILSVVNSSMIGNAWRLVASNPSSISQQLIAYAVCVSGLSGTTTQVGKQVSIAAGTSGGNTVTCPSGTTVTGGGFSQNNVEVFLTEQNQNGWTTSAKSGNSSGLLNTYAICYGPASLSTFTVGAQYVVAANGEGQAAAECPQGSLVTGGGFAINNPPGYGRVHAMMKIGNAWRAVLKNFPTGTSNVLNVYATCMNL